MTTAIDRQTAKAKIETGATPVEALPHDLFLRPPMSAGRLSVMLAPSTRGHLQTVVAGSVMRRLR